jgi:hypothetical protein
MSSCSRPVTAVKDLASDHRHSGNVVHRPPPGLNQPLSADSSQPARKRHPGSSNPRVQNGPFCTRPAGKPEIFQEAQIGGSRAPLASQSVIAAPRAVVSERGCWPAASLSGGWLVARGLGLGERGVGPSRRVRLGAGCASPLRSRVLADRGPGETGQTRRPSGHARNPSEGGRAWGSMICIGMSRSATAKAQSPQPT